MKGVTVSIRKNTTIYLIVCLVDFRFHSYQISSDFFAYDIATDVHLVIAVILEIATVTFCFKQSRLVNGRQLQGKRR